jgi:CheY-like chemotaxis protein
MRKKIICIIDDEEINHLIVKTIIKRLDIQTHFLPFNNGEEAITALKQLSVSNVELPDIILLDINMPVMDGWEFLNNFIKIKPQIDKKIEIYILSSSSASEDINKSKSYAEISGYLCKPIAAETLRNIIQSEFDE